jgi:hypothetical protein
MVTIPRYTGSLGSAPIRSSRRITTGTAGSDALMNLGKTLTDGLSAFTEQKIAMTAKLRDQEIRNKGLLAGTDMSQWIEDTKQRYSDRDDYPMFQSMYNKDYETQKNFIKKKHFTYNGVLDEVAWNAYQSDLAVSGVTGKIEINKIYNQKRNKETELAFQGNLEVISRDINNATSPAKISELYQRINAFYSDYERESIFDTQVLATSKTTTLNNLLNKSMILQTYSEEGLPTYINPDGKSAFDWGAIAARLQDPNVKITNLQGQNIDATNPLRESLAKDLQQRDQIQKNSDSVRLNYLQKKDLEQVNEALADSLQKNTVSQDRDVLVDLVQRSNLTEDNKVNKIELIDRHARGEETAKISKNSAQTEQEGKENFIKTEVLVNSGIFDTEEEINIIKEMAFDGAFGNEDWGKLVDKAIELADERNSWKKDLYKQGITNLLKSMGVKNVDPQSPLLALTGGIDAIMTKDDAVNGIKRFDFNNLQSAAVREFDRLLISGEKAGFSYDSMLVDIESPNYLPTKIAKIYTQNMNEAMQEEFNSQILSYEDVGDTRVFYAEKYFVDPKDYTASGLVSNNVNVDVPPRNEGETVADYIDRIRPMTLTVDTEYKDIMPDFLISKKVTFADGIIIDNEVD